MTRASASDVARAARAALQAMQRIGRRPHRHRAAAMFRRSNGACVVRAERRTHAIRRAEARANQYCA
ncbi:hypothetical protein BURMUCF2_A0637 [Burkholderia multivorans CF2]|nr:hypothetical protein BURMUCF2_A0637 [Burkholderia multivorans CF2]